MVRRNNCNSCICWLRRGDPAMLFGCLGLCWTLRTAIPEALMDAVCFGTALGADGACKGRERRKDVPERPTHEVLCSLGKRHLVRKDQLQQTPTTASASPGGRLPGAEEGRDGSSQQPDGPGGNGNQQKKGVKVNGQWIPPSFSQDPVDSVPFPFATSIRQTQYCTDA